MTLNILHMIFLIEKMLGQMIFGAGSSGVSAAYLISIQTRHFKD